jgi:hypothetical protein
MFSRVFTDFPKIIDHGFPLFPPLVRQESLRLIDGDNAWIGNDIENPRAKFWRRCKLQYGAAVAKGL